MTPTMTSQQRIIAALRRQPVDRIPCSPRMHAWVLSEYGRLDIDVWKQVLDRFPVLDWDTTYPLFPLPSDLGLRESWENLLPNIGYRFEKRVADDDFTEIRRWFDTPKGRLTDLTRYPPKGDRRFGISPNPIRAETLLKTPADLDALRCLITPKHLGDFAGFRQYQAAFGDRVLITPNILSCLCHRAGDVYPMEELMMAYYDDRGFFDDMLDLYHQEMLEEVRQCLSHGIIHMFANWYYNSLSAGWSPAIWEEVFIPQLKEMTDLVHAAGGTVNFYDDGKFMPILDLLGASGIDALQTLTPPPVGDCDLAEVKRRIGDRVCLMGYVDLIYVIQHGTPKLIDETVRQAVDIAGPTGFILGTSDSIRDGTPTENVEAYFNAAMKYCVLS